MGQPHPFTFLQHDPYSATLFGLSILFLTAWLFGRLFERLHQPPVVGEILAGLMLGPSLLGSLSSRLFPTTERPMLGILAQVGVAVFMFLVGLDLDIGRLRRGGQHRVAGAVAVSGTIVPFLLGMVMALALHSSDPRPPLPLFCLFIGVSLSVTAFPVLARIVLERDLADRPLGALAMLVAAESDLLTWTVLILVLTIGISGSWLEGLYSLALIVAFVVLMAGPVRRALVRFGNGRATVETLLLLLAGIVGCAALTASIGLHEIFGGFILGAVFPRGRLATQARRLVLPIGRSLLPIFFVTTGLQVDVRTLGSEGAWQFGLILAVACLGKIGGATAGARLGRLPLRESAGLGVLMNTRGLTELIVLTIGLQEQILTTQLFTAFVLMSVVTTMAADPLLRLVRPDPYLGTADGRSATPLPAPDPGRPWAT